MAAFTVTASDQSATPRALHTGETVVRKVLKGTLLPASLSASDIVLIAKIPNGSYITDFYMSGTAGGAGQVFKVGIPGSDNAVLSAGTLSETPQLVRANGGGLPVKVSLSDDAVPQFAWLFATRASGTATATCSIQFLVKYAGPGAI